MAKDINIKNKRCRWYRNGCCWVSDDGELAAVPVKGGGKKDIVPILLSPQKKKYIQHPWYGIIGIGAAVATCFCPPHPNDGKRWQINFKDNDSENCSYKNLEWTQYHYKTSNNPSELILIEDQKVEVFKTGYVEKDGAIQIIRDEVYDTDTDLWNCTEPYIHVYREHTVMDDVMKMAGYIQGDDADLNRPVILHRDYNLKNFNSDNLEWCEVDDPRYKAYLEQKEKDKHQRRVELNPGKTLHPGW